ncbi:134_t:CDS:1, partial [Racocetra persica]
HNNADTLSKIVEDKCNTFNLYQKVANIGNTDETHKKDMILKLYKT